MTTIKTPANAAASEVVRLRSVNTDILEQIRILHETRDRNSETIGVLEHAAVWQDVIIEEDVDPEVPVEEEAPSGEE